MRMRRSMVVAVAMAAWAAAALADEYPHLVVCADAGAGGHEGLPDVCRLEDGRLICVFYAGYAHGSPPSEQLPKGGRIVYCYSDDEGATWTPPRLLVDTELDDRDPNVAQLPDGRLVVTFMNSYGPQGAWLGTWIMESHDNGQTWSPPRHLAAGYFTSSPIRMLSSGRLVAPLYAMRDGRGWAAVMLSDDDGRTWSDPIDIPHGELSLPAETDVVELADGRLCAAQRADFNFPPGTHTPMQLSFSQDSGRTWSPPQPIGFPAITPYLLRIDDAVVLAYGSVDSRGRRWGTSLRISRDGCQTWSEPVLVDDVLGCHPSMVLLRDGSVLVVYYDESKGPTPEVRSNIRTRRFRLTDSGIEWLPIHTARN